MCTCVIRHISIMKSIESPEDVRRWFLRQISELWPLAIGSLSLRTGPCIRENCSACQRGKGHASYALYGRQKNRRFSVYVQKLIGEAGLRYTAALKGQRAAGSLGRKRQGR